MTSRILTFLPAALIFSSSAVADVEATSSTHYVLHHEASSPLEPDALWDRLIEPASWWHPDHTYSGDARNLSLEATAGGLWLETWDGGSVAHGEVLLAREGEMLRMNAPFGPLQGIGAYTIWTISITAVDGGSLVTFDEVASAPPGNDMEQLAGAVDYVKTEAIARLVAGEDADESGNR